jgi:hypothetical protein
MPPEENQTGSSTSGRPGRKGLTGDSCWGPAPDVRGITWSVATCHDLGREPDAGHAGRLIDRLAATRGKDAQALRRPSVPACTDLPRGRVTRPGKEFLILHGNDSPATAEVGPVRSPTISNTHRRLPGQ